jgi:hypoxanthine phosphoribosyltransferase
MTVKVWGRELNVTQEQVDQFDESREALLAAYAEVKKKEKSEEAKQKRLALKERKAQGIPPKPEDHRRGFWLITHVWNERQWAWKPSQSCEYEWSHEVANCVHDAWYSASSAALAKMTEIALQDAAFLKEQEAYLWSRERLGERREAVAMAKSQGVI